MLSDHDGINFEIDNRRKFKKFTNIGKLNIILLNNQWVEEEITRKIRNCFEIK